MQRGLVGIAAVLASPYLRYLLTEFPGLYTARCVQQGDRASLLVTRIHRKGDIRPTVQEVLGPQMGCSRREHRAFAIWGHEEAAKPTAFLCCCS